MTIYSWCFTHEFLRESGLVFLESICELLMLRSPMKNLKQLSKDHQIHVCLNGLLINKTREYLIKANLASTLPSNSKGGVDSR